MIVEKKQRAKILLIAYACRPGESSERQIGWHWANLIQRHHDVTVLTRETHRPFIENHLASRADDAPTPEFIYFDLPAWAARFKKGDRGLYVYYALWSFFAILRTRRMNEGGRWQITHFLTFGTLIWPQFAFLMNTAYLLGPVGGGERIPLSLRKSFGYGGQLKILARRLVQKMLVLNPIYWANLAQADRIFVRTKETLEMLPARYHGKTKLLLETAISLDQTQLDTPIRDNEKLEIVSVGRLIASKFNPLMLEALATFKAEWKKPFRVTIIGDGPERENLEAQRDKLGLREVEFVGKKSSDEVFAELRRSDIYYSTTMKEGGTWAFFEAIACYLPIVCLKVNGPDMIVGEGCGIKVPPISYKQTRDALARGVLALAQDPLLRADYAERARAHVEQTYSWDQVSMHINITYAELLAQEKSSSR